MSDFNQNDLHEVNASASAPIPQVPNKKGFDIAALVLGITSIIPGCCCTYVGILLGILAIVFSVLFTKANEGMDVKKGMAKIGMILGIIGLVLCIGLMIFGFVFSTSDMYQEILNQVGTYN